MAKLIGILTAFQQSCGNAQADTKTQKIAHKPPPRGIISHTAYGCECGQMLAPLITLVKFSDIQIAFYLIVIT
jgi:hypothetical protein